MRRCVPALPFLALLLLAADSPPSKDLPLVFQEDFSKGAERWQPSDPMAWKIIDTPRGKAFSQFKQSSYKPPVRSPLNFALVKDLLVTDFVLEARLQSTVKDYAHRDMCLFFGYQDPSHF